MKSSLWIVLGLLALSLMWWMLRRRPTRAPEASTRGVTRPMPPKAPIAQVSPMPQSAPQPGVAERRSSDPVPAAVIPVRRAPPQPLAAFTLTAFELAPPERIEQMVAGLAGIPRPPRALHQMVSIEFVSRASSAELGDLVMTEPLVAAKVVSKVNSPLYGIQQPVTNIGQAITFLGMSAIRNVCLRYLLDESFKADSPQIRSTFETLRRSSNIASELCARLAPRLQVRDPGSLVTQVILSFIGHFAASVLLVKLDKTRPDDLQDTLLGRLRYQQQALGLAAPEIGRVLMHEWKLPQALSDEVASLDHLIVTPLGATRDAEPHRLALGYLCVRLGERFASGRMEDLEQLDEMLEQDVDFHHLRAYLALPELAGLRDVLQQPEMLTVLRS